MERESFVFYRSFYDAIKDLPDEESLCLFQIICKYALYGEEPDVNGVGRAMFTLIRPQIDANNRKYINGKKGGRPVKKNIDDDWVNSESEGEQ